jgi:23S rRNA (guanine745-N1)-methyltransferase
MPSAANSVSPALAAALAALRCPVCASPLAGHGRALRCARGHSYDIARQGYVNLDTGGGRPRPADTVAMIAARESFLGQRHYAPIADAVSGLARRLDPAGSGIILDLAGWTGYYLAAVLESRPGRTGIVLDRSKPALRQAARAHPRAAAVGSDVWRDFPLAGRSASIVLSVFGPRNLAETIRVLDPAGIFLLVTPDHRHLAELTGPLGLLSVDKAKPQRVEAATAGFRLAASQPLSYPLRLGHAAVHDLVSMGPSAYHIPPAQLGGRIAALPDPVTVTAAVTVAAYRVR